MVANLTLCSKLEQRFVNTFLLAKKCLQCENLQKNVKKNPKKLHTVTNGLIMG